MSLLAPACGGTPTREEEAAPYPTYIGAPSSFPGEWAIEQEVSIAHAEGESSFRAVLQKRGDTLTMLGLGPAGGRAFALTQTGLVFDWETFVPIELPFPPEYMLYDVHRTWLQPIQPPVDGATELVFERHDERVTETWRGAKLFRRVFERLDGDPGGSLVVEYQGGLAANAPAEGGPPDLVTFDNGWHGYRASVRTLNYTVLESSGSQDQ
jgi:hypothetical protein